jgi:hypothetical protein
LTKEAGFGIIAAERHLEDQKLSEEGYRRRLTSRGCLNKNKNKNKKRALRGKTFLKEAFLTERIPSQTFYRRTYVLEVTARTFRCESYFRIYFTIRFIF